MSVPNFGKADNYKALLSRAGGVVLFFRSNICEVSRYIGSLSHSILRFDIKASSLLKPLYNISQLTLAMASKYPVIDITGSVPMLGQWRIWLGQLNAMMGLLWRKSGVEGRQGKGAQRD